MTRKWMFGATVLTAVLALAATGCGDDEGDSGDSTTAATTPATNGATDGASGGANEELCSGLDDLATAIEDVQGISSASTIAELGTALTGVVTAWDGVKSAAEEVAQSEAVALETSIDDLRSTIQGLAGSDTLGEAQADVQSAAGDVSDAREELSTSAECT